MSVLRITEKPIVWEAHQNNEHWHDSVYGVWISYDEHDQPGEEYTDGWGEGDTESFSTLEEAKEHLQIMLDEWISKVAVVTITKD